MWFNRNLRLTNSPISRWFQFILLAWCLRLGQLQEDDGVPPVSLDKNIPMLRNISHLTSDQSYSEDPILVQKYDRLNSYSEYFIPTDKAEHVVFSHRHDNREYQADVIYLAKGEDTLPIYSNKMVYVGLRNAPDYDPSNRRRKFYSVYFAYMREAFAQETPQKLVSHNGKNIRVEYDSYDSRGVNYKTHFNYGWNKCSSTSFFTCSVDDETTDHYNALIEKLNLTLYPEPHHGPPTYADVEAINKTKILAEPGYDPDEYLDLFGDLNIDPRNTQVEKKAGRGMFNNVACGFFAASCDSKKLKASSRKSKSRAKGRSSKSSYGSTYKETINREIFGTYYEGLRGTQPIFLPQGLPTPATFVPDPDENFPSMTGIFFPPTKAYGHVFIPDEDAVTDLYMKTKGTLIPSELKATGTGGIRGSMDPGELGAVFTPKPDSNDLWFNPSGPEASGVWTPSNPVEVLENLPMRPSTTESGSIISYGVLFPGIPGAQFLLVMKPIQDLGNRTLET